MRQTGKMNPDAAELKDIACFILDMDGTVNLGDTLIAGAVQLFELLDEMGVRYAFFTNNSSHSPLGYVEKLTRLGLPGITREHIMTSGDVMVHTLQTMKENPRVYLAGTPELEEQFRQADIELLAETCDTADFAVLGFDTTFDFRKADTLCRLATAGVPLLATNIDRICPLEGGRFLPDCGSMAALVEHATGITPEFVGKPSARTVEYILVATGVPKERCAIVGDRLYTDIQTAVNGGITGIAVLSGEIGWQDIEQGDVHVDYVLNSVQELYESLRDAKN